MYYELLPCRFDCLVHKARKISNLTTELVYIERVQFWTQRFVPLKRRPTIMLTLESRQLHSYCMFDFLSYIPLYDSSWLYHTRFTFYLSEGEVEHMGHGVVGSHIGTPLVIHLAHHLTPNRHSASLHLRDTPQSSRSVRHRRFLKGP